MQLKAPTDDAPRITSLAGLREAEKRCPPLPIVQGLRLEGSCPGRGPLSVRPPLLDEALAAAGIDRKRVFVTNAVKHFKYERRGKRRLHKRPNAHEIDRCRWWQDMERAIVKPAIIVAMGATAARSLLGRPTTIQKVRGQALSFSEGAEAFVTIHPSAILRITDSADKQRQYRAFVDDLRLAGEALDRK